MRRSRMASGEMTVLVLAVGGTVSQGLLKSLAHSSLPCRTIGACISPLSAGLYVCDRSYLSPVATDPEFPEWLFDICRREEVQAVLAGNEAVLQALAEHAEALRRETGAVAIVSSPDRLAIAGDKLETCRWLELTGLHFPRYAASDDPDAVQSLLGCTGFPLHAKPRCTSGSRGGFRVDDEAQLAAACRRPGYLLQEYLGDASQEYTAGCFSDRAGRVRGTIVLHRRIESGLTVRAEAGEFPECREEAIRIAEVLRPLGPCNIQMRMHRGRAVCFEINLRFSSTTPIRTTLGFRELEAALRHFVLGEVVDDLPRIMNGVALRYWNEIYTDNATVQELRSAGCIDAALSRNLARVETFGMRRNDGSDGERRQE